ncbi:copper chaperone PCu(A)C [Actinoplanes sp. CA-051413]|uniref:copper chaperone PCu(A)C n=1 Tax=Actinoplanes sp. CA-051413 TaxID=3239899 RepID=UPI003D954755
MSNPLNFGARRTLAAALLAGALTTLGLAGCGGSDAAGGTPVPAAAPSASASTGLVVKDPWVKAAKAGTMTAAFAILVNDSATDITVVGAESPASPMELHEMTMQDGKMLMRPKQGGFVIKARSTHELGPGGDHLMLMKPAAAIDAGNEVTFTLKLADGGTVPFTAIAKPFAGAGESYDPGMSMPASGMPMAPMGSAAP